MWAIDYSKIERWGWIDSLFTKEECERIISIGNKQKIIPAKIGSKADEAVDQETRVTDIAWLWSQDEETHWIYERIAGAVISINNDIFQYDLKWIQSLQFSVYPVGGNYKEHIDTHYETYDGTRKLSFSIILNDDFEGGDLEINAGDPHIKPEQKTGKTIFFNSMLPHTVTPVTKGTRYSLVGWVAGPPWK